jgi:hypothetical protein
MNGSESLAQLVAEASRAQIVNAAASLHLRLPSTSELWPARVISRTDEGCLVRVADQHDALLPQGSVPPNVQILRIRATADGVILFPAA